MSYKVLDVSEWQEKIDWDKAWKSKAFSAVILRCGYGTDERSKDDKQWIRNVSECERLGIPYGVYLYSYSNGSTTTSEINHVLRLLKGHSPSLPVYIDLEESKYANVFLKNAQLFCSAIEKSGYKAGVYSGAYLFKTYLTKLDKKYSRWIASYGKNKNGTMYDNAKPNYNEDGWQYTSTATVKGINGTVDMSIFYTDYLKDKKQNNNIEINIKEKEADKMSVTPITDYTKYRNMVSNSGGDENGGIHGGKAGDQTGKEWYVRSWYDFGQNIIIRFNDRNIANTLATLSIYAAQNNNVGYDQYERGTYNTQLKKVGNDPRKISTKCEDDCSAGVLANIRGSLELTNHKDWADKINTSGTTWSIASIVRKCGANVTMFTDLLHCRSNKYLLPGDIILNESRHVNVNLGLGSMMSQADVIGSNKENNKNSKADTKVSKKKAVKELQKAMNSSYGLKLVVDGDCGKNTKKAIDSHYLYYRPRTIQNSHVRWFQQRLFELGYDIDVDGSFGSQTKSICKKFQKKYGLEVDGYAGLQTHLKIISLF